MKRGKSSKRTHRTLREGFGDHGAPAGRGGHGTPALAAVLPLDVIDAAELVEQGALDPPLPQATQRRCGGRAQRGMARLRQRKLRAVALGQLAGLEQPWPGERPDRTDRLLPALLLLRGVEEVASVQHLGDTLHRCRRRAARLRTRRDPTEIDQAQHRLQVPRRRRFHVSSHELDPIERRGFALPEPGVPGYVDRLGQIVLGVESRFRGRRNESSQAIRQVRRDTERLGAVAARGIEEQAQLSHGFESGESIPNVNTRPDDDTQPQIHAPPVPAKQIC